MANQVKITQVRSAINREESQKRTIKALGIRGLNKPVIKNDSPQIRGMIYKVRHMVKVEEV
ncbi:MAG: 50S ribosomal protein L30 [Candidatus Eisenbacteria bacterium]|uniref:50S ribosomal protein L30 n=1 Tax=Eiseniibacteriota bacterium TaxID=2212470 RepID=A0A7Y2E4P2_UNCEI|nr:50S ribosomal protein L30 [Candidatus Eisenbacteria bacterium]